MNVSEMIRKLNMTREDFFPLAQKLGFDIGERAIKIDDRVARKLMDAIKGSLKEGTKKSLFADEVDEEEEETSDKGAAKGETIEIEKQIAVKDLAEKLGKEVTDMIAILMQQGIMATVNENLDFETATIVLEDLGYKVKKAEAKKDGHEPKASAEKIKDILDTEKKKKTSLKARPPVIVVMGHVDHGKTKLLDAIRKTNVVDQEAGGITQSIGAYQVKHKNKAITFIDTPGHEAFTAMRSRGANIADLAILVVAADDGVKPQTIEAVSILEKAQLPFVVAVNKIDKEGADPEKVKKGLSELNLIPEDWGGKTICVPVSAKQGTNIEDLLDMVLLVADMEGEKIVANPDRDAVGTIIESKIDKESGALATVLVQTGTLRIGDAVIVGRVVGKIKAMQNWQGEEMKLAGPGTPARILGLKGAAVVGDILQIGTDKKAAKQKNKKYRSFGFIEMKKAEKESKQQSISLMIKADTLGSLEALVATLQKIKSPEVGIDFAKKDLGNITEKNVLQAEASNAIILGFNVDLTPAARDEMHGKNIVFKSSPIIYELIDFVKEQIEEVLPPEIIFELRGALKILAVFKAGAKNMIVGGKVTEGEFDDKALIKVKRSGKQIGEGKLKQLQHEKKNVSKLEKGQEGGVSFEGTTQLKEGDVLEAYEKVEKKRKLEETKV